MLEIGKKSARVEVQASSDGAAGVLHIHDGQLVHCHVGAIMPSVNVSSDLGYIGSGESNFGGGFIQPTSAFVTSGYSLGLQWQLNGRALTAPAEQKALQRATDEDISGAGVALRAEIETQYLTTLQATAQVAVARQQVTRNADFLALAKARYQVGQATLLDVRQAEVIKGQSDVALLRAVQAENEAKLDLIRRMGVEPPVPVDQIALSDSFPVTAPAFQLDSLLALADQQNPTLRSLRARKQPRHRGPLRQERVPADAVRAGRLERVHPAVHQRATSCSTRPWPMPRPQAASCQSTMRCAPRSGLDHRLLRCRRARPDSGTRCWIPVSPADPRRQQRLPLQLHRPAVPGEPADLAPDLHRVRALAPAVAGPGGRTGRRRERAGPPAPGAERRARPLSSRSRPRIRRSPCRRPTGRPRATSCAWPRTATGSAPAPRSRCPTRRTPCSRPRATT